jgi:drug/metabolite transporter (DMT)-like permease
VRLADLPADVRGGGWIFLSGALFMLSTAIIRHLGDGGLPEGVIVFFRFLFGLVAFLPVIVRTRGAFVATRRPGAHAVRSFLGFSAFLCYVYAIGRLPLGDAVALTFTFPLWSTLLAVLVLGERIGAVRIALLAAGFGGVLLIARPTGDLSAEQALAAGAALLSAFLASLAMLTVRRLTQTEPPDRIAFYFILGGTIFATPAAAADFRMPSAEEFAWLVPLGLLVTAVQMALVRGYAIGTFSKMAPVDFTRLPMAVLIGFALFAEVPDGRSALGMAVIAASSLGILLSGRKPPAPAPAKPA